MYNRPFVHTIANNGRIPLSNGKICVELQEKSTETTSFPCFFAPILCFFEVNHLVVAYNKAFRV